MWCLGAWNDSLDIVGTLLEFSDHRQRRRRGGGGGRRGRRRVLWESAEK